MKTILLLLGPNGIGKSTTAKCILDKLPNSALVDSEWCRAMNPYNMDTAVNNLYALVKNYLLCSEIEVIVFPYGFHGDRKQRYDIVIDKLRGDKIDFSEFTVILTCSYEENIARLQNDMRDIERINRGMKNTFHFYDEYDFPKIDTTNLTVTQTADEIIKLFINRGKSTSKFGISSPESQGIPSDAIIELVNEFENRDFQVTSFMLLRNGNKLAHFCKPPYNMESIQLWFSVTKSFTGIGVGIACDKGLLSLDDYIVNFFPDKLPTIISDNLSKMRVSHLLSMASGIHDNTYGLLYPQEDWVKAFLEQDFPHEPGTYYRYSTHCSHVLAAVVEHVSGQSFYNFIKTNLFKPLEIYESTWETCSQGITAGGMGLGLTVESVAKFAQMILNKGIYNGKRIVSEEYLSAAMTEQSNNREQEKGNHTNGYGFHMRIDNDGSLFHSGAFGQLWYICPRKNIVIVLTSRLMNTNMDVVIDLLQDKIINSALEKELLPSDGYERMKEKLKNLSYPVPTIFKFPQSIFPLPCKTYLLSDNPHKLQSIGFNEDSGQFRMKMQYADRPDSVIDFRFCEAVYGSDIFVKDIQLHMQKYVSYAVWENDKTIVLTIFYIETPYEVKYRIDFNGDKINVAFHMNVSLNLQNFECYGVLGIEEECK